MCRSVEKVGKLQDPGVHSYLFLRVEEKIDELSQKQLLEWDRSTWLIPRGEIEFSCDPRASARWLGVFFESCFRGCAKNSLTGHG